jgi:hypothetical protein
MAPAATGPTAGADTVFVDSQALMTPPAAVGVPVADRNENW